MDTKFITLKIMKLKINKSNQKDVNKLKDLIVKNREKEDILFNSTVKKMNLSKDESEILFDYVYNDCDWMVEIE